MDPEALARIIRVARGPKPILLSDTLERYLAEHRRGKDIKFIRNVRIAIDLVVQTIGDMELKALTRDHARLVRDALTEGHSTATIRRRLGSVNAVINFGRREFSLECGNPFESLQIAREGLDTKKRLPFTLDERQRIEIACRTIDDDIRHIVAIQLSTGARLAEIVGLRREDIFLEWLSKSLGILKTTHSARHTMKDMLRNSGVPEEMSKAILGHGSLSVADRYGSGFSLQRKLEALSQALARIEMPLPG